MIPAHGNSLLQSENQLFFLIFSSSVVLICFWLTFHYLKRARLIEDTPTSKIRSASQGYVEIKGTVSYGKNRELIAPLSGNACVWYTYKIQRYQRSGKNSHWSTVEEGTSKRSFLIQDNTGICVIDPEGAEVLTEHSRTWYGNTERPKQTKNTNIFFSVIGGRRYRYIEKFIYVHDLIYALGNFKTSGGGRAVPSNHQITGQVIREWKQDYNQILNRFDQDKNGEINILEWETVRAAASREAEKRRQRLSRMPTVYTLSNTTHKQHPFILSTFSQKTLAKKFRSHAILSLIGALLFVAFLIIQFFES
ncbi:MAG TPA: GIDE domain-containing protein [Nitrosomonas sp.]|nr:GIDE domain-containing protein [Nitrosomonas sp.]